MSELDKPYNPSNFESNWYKLWEEHELFEPTGTGEPFCMVLPPPNVTGVLHIGHALNQTLQDIIARYKRMKGYDVLWIPGTDHAGIATQNVVEKELAKKGISRFDLGREKFIDEVWKWRAEYGDRIVDQIKHLGSSLSWKHQRFTMDNDMSMAVKTVFISLYNKGLIYKGNRMINWCPRCLTALSDLEVEHTDKSGFLWYIKYCLKNNDSKSIVVATTRPETLFGDTAVAVNPTDDRYREFIGKTVLVPFVNREIPVIADDYVDPKFGTGALKIAPAHSPNDFEIGKRFNLPVISVFTDDGKMNDQAAKFEGLDRYSCRELVVKELKKAALLTGEEQYMHSIGHCYRCRTETEPKISEQWFVKTKEMAKTAKQAIIEGEARFVPAQWKKTFYEWMDNIYDWCISRQIWWGHRIPAYYCDNCTKMVVAAKSPEKCPICGGNMHQDEDVLDTWFSSALWPFSTLGWPTDTKLLERFYPNSVVVTGFDIIFFWVARMMMMGITFMDKVPFRNIYIHALIRDKHNQKMSKSKGNVIDPLVVISKYGADSVRFTLAALSIQGRDILLSEERIEGFRRFANKIWNAFKLIKKLLNGRIVPDIIPQHNMTTADRWIITETNRAAEQISYHLDRYHFHEAADIIYGFIWHKFCDVYLEIAKKEIERYPNETIFTLAGIAGVILKNLHPFMPFITEEIWSSMREILQNGQTTYLMKTRFPKSGSGFLVNYEDEHKDMESILDAVKLIRSLKSDLDISTREIVDAKLISSDDSVFYECRQYIEQLAFVRIVDDNLIGAHRIGNSVEIIIEATGKEKKKAALKIDKKAEKLKNRIVQLEKRLNNSGFLEHAERSVVTDMKIEYKYDLEQIRQLEKKILEIDKL